MGGTAGFRLKRLLKPRLLHEQLTRALTIAPAGTQLAVRADGRLLCHCPEQAASVTSSSNVPLRLGLRLEGTSIGELLVYLPADVNSTDADAPPAFATYVAKTLETLLEQEHGRRALASETLDRYREIELLHRSTVNLNNPFKVREVVRSLLAESRKIVPTARLGAIYVREPRTSAFLPQHTWLDADAPGLPDGFADGGHSLVERLPDTRLFESVRENARGEIVNDLLLDERFTTATTAANALLIVPLSAPHMQVGMLVLASPTRGHFTSDDLKRVETIASIGGIAIGNAYHFEGMQVLTDALLQALAAAIDSRDPYTSGHSQRVARLAVAFARELEDNGSLYPQTSFTEAELHEIYYAGLLHDVGKIGVREEVLTKGTRVPPERMRVIGDRLALIGQATGYDWKADYEQLRELNVSGRLTKQNEKLLKRLSHKQVDVDERTICALEDEELYCLQVPFGNLTPEERREIERHPEESYRILQHIPFPDNYARLLTYIHQHHERLDGSGYPYGLHGPDIHLPSRLLAIVDIYDAITQERHYKKAFTREEALTILQKEARVGRIDRRLVDVFRTRIEAIEAVAEAQDIVPKGMALLSAAT